jgi:hypothetical protein
MDIRSWLLNADAENQLLIDSNEDPVQFVSRSPRKAIKCLRSRRHLRIKELLLSITK